MSTAYWNQYSYDEIMSMNGIEIDKEIIEVDLDIQEDELENKCCSHGCMNCLGLSWSDFY